MAEKKNKTKSVNIKNKRASFDFLLLDKYTAGIVLTGTEIKSIRAGKASLVDTFCFIHNGEVWVKNMYVAEYSYGSYNNHAARRDRKLLLNRKEIRKLQQDMKSPGLCRGKKEYDKRQTLKEKEDRREIDRQVKRY